MNGKAAGTFEVKLIPLPNDVTPDIDTLGRMSIDKTFQGDLSGMSKGQMLSARTPVKGSAAYVAIERFEGTLHGKEGSFILQHTGVMKGPDQSLTITVVPDSGTDELKGLTGQMAIIIESTGHTYEFDYTLAE